MPCDSVLTQGYHILKGLDAMNLSKKWTRKWARRTVAGIVAGGLCLMTPLATQAEEKQEYTFDPVLITALRRETTELKTPASVHVECVIRLQKVK